MPADYWLKEIAYQLAIMNERNVELDREIIEAPKALYNDLYTNDHGFATNVRHELVADLPWDRQ